MWKGSLFLVFSSAFFISFFYVQCGPAASVKDAVAFTGTSPGGSGQEESFTLKFSDDSRRELTGLARAAAKEVMAGRNVSYEPSSNPELQIKAGCFVTIKNKGNLRGCIGCFTSDGPLWKTVRDMAVAAATRDYRFTSNPLNSNELSISAIEVSVLSPLRRVFRPLEEIKVGRDGIFIEANGRSGTLLPQVALEQGWSLEEFLGHCSRDKAGLGWDGWKGPSARVFVYSTSIIEEEGSKERAEKNQLQKNGGKE